LTPTIKSLAAELGVTEQALRSWCKRNEIEKTTKGKITSYVITEEVAEQIKNHYAKQHNESESKPQRKHNENDTTKAYIDSLLKQIEDLKADKDKLNARLDKAATERDKDRNERQAILTQLFSLQAENKELQTELNKYKAIAESKQTVVEVPAEDQTEQEQPTEREQEQQPTKQPAEDPPPQKLSFLQRLFKRGKRSD
jgi:phage host-nuclease inhibitor protein Gam